MEERRPTISAVPQGRVEGGPQSDAGRLVVAQWLARSAGALRGDVEKDS